MGFQYRASPRLRYQSFDNRLEDKPRVWTLIRQSLMVCDLNSGLFSAIQIMA